MLTVYGIPNCDTIKKTLKWFQSNGVEHQFHNYRKEGIGREKIENWLDQQPVEKLLNKTSSTWKKLLDEQKEQAVTREGAIGIMLENPTIIKRPVVEDVNGKIRAVGFKEAEYDTLFGQSH